MTDAIGGDAEADATAGVAGHTIRLLEYPRFISGVVLRVVFSVYCVLVLTQILSDLITKSLSLRSKIDLPFDMVNQVTSATDLLA
eukprot:3712829-Rhodomonas_salina.1